MFIDSRQSNEERCCLSATELNPMLGDARDIAWTTPTTTKLLCEFPASRVRLVSELCIGRYGPVYHAELLAEPIAAGSRCACRPVAAKTLSASASPDMVGHN